MSVRLDWEVDGTDDLSAPQPMEDFGASEAEDRDARRSSSVTTPARVGGWLLLLVIAAVGGFWLGRWSEARAFVVHGVENQLTLESLAWREGDRELYESTLDPWASTEWRAAQIFRFITQAPIVWRPHLEDVVALEEGRRLQVSIRVSGSGSGQDRAERVYVLRGDRWLRTEP